MARRNASGLPPESHGPPAEAGVYAQLRMARRCGPVVSFLGLIFVGCAGGGLPGKPDLPASVPPAWTLQSYAPSPAPEGLPAGAAPQCWKAEYAGSGAADVWACGFRVSGSAFDAEQRTRAEANTVKFQEGNFLVIARWTAGSRADVTSLIRTIQKSMQVR